MFAIAVSTIVTSAVPVPLPTRTRTRARDGVAVVLIAGAGAIFLARSLGTDFAVAVLPAALLTTPRTLMTICRLGCRR